MRICKMCKNMHTKDILIWASVASGVMLMGGACVAVWNSKKMKTARALHHTAQYMKTAGDVLQNVARALG